MSRAWDELTTNRELHKGLEFGLRAAGEVSKDVWEKVATHAATAYAGKLFSADPPAPSITQGFGAGAGLAWTGVKSYMGFPQLGRDVGDRLSILHKTMYGTK